MRREYREQAVSMGANGGLIGVVARGSNDVSSDLAAIIMNAGVIHHVGPSRLSVRMARELAKIGLQSIRFDLSGIGDSAPRRDTTSLEKSVVLDIAETMRFLTKTRGAQRFIFLGLCSGGREAFRAAHRDPRVKGAVMIDPIAYKTSGFYLRHYGRRLPRAESWKNALMGENNYVKRMRERLAEPAVEMVSDSSQDDDVAGLPRWPNRQQFGAALARTLEREARLLFIYTGGMEDYNYDKQFEDTFPDAAQSPFLSVHYLQEADHVFSTEDSRIVLFQLLKRWLKQAGFVTESEQQAIS